MDNKSRIQQNRLLAAFQTAISPLITVFSQFFGVKFSVVCLNLLLLLSSCRPEPSPLPETFIPVPAVVRGADLSFLPEMRLAVTDFKNTQGEVEDPLKTLSVAGMNIIRLRLWHQPEGKYSLREAIAIAQEAKLMNLPLWISLHYSDTWADPGSQTKPTQWHNIDFELLKDSIYHYTYRVASTLQPAILQIGNEINQGILWPEGHISQHSQMSALLAEGIRGCRNASPQTKIMLHYAGLSGAYVFFGNLLQLDYDYIGLSYYPIWHGKSLAETGSVVQELKNTFAKDVLIAETSYPFTFEWADNTHNVVGNSSQTIPSYRATPHGQRSYLQALGQTVGESGGRGWCYWGTEWVAAYGSQSTNGSSWENQALWDFNHYALPAMTIFDPTQ